MVKLVSKLVPVLKPIGPGFSGWYSADSERLMNKCLCMSEGTNGQSISRKKTSSCQISQQSLLQCTNCYKKKDRKWQKRVGRGPTSRLRKVKRSNAVSWGAGALQPGEGCAIMAHITKWHRCCAITSHASWNWDTNRIYLMNTKRCRKNLLEAG